MSAVETMEKLVLVCLGFLNKAAITVFPLSGASVVMFIILNDPLFSRLKVFAFASSALFIFSCLLLTLSKICVLRRKPQAEDKTIDELWDSDLKYENASEEVPHYKLSYRWKDIRSTLKNFLLKNPFEFCKFRPAYGMFFATGLVLVAVFVASLSQVKEWNVKDDFFCVAKGVCCPMIMLITLIYFISNSGIYTAEKESDMYVHFEEFIQVPMKTVVGKTTAAFVTSAVTRWLLVSFVLSVTTLCVTTSDFYRNSEVENFLKSLLLTVYPEPQKLVNDVLILVAVFSASVSILMILISFFQVKKSILGIIEKNWQRNFLAIDFILPTMETDSLEDLKVALDHKLSQPLPEMERQAFSYLSRPIWRTKKAFMFRKFEADAPESDASDRPDELDKVDPARAEHPVAETDGDESGHVKPVLAVQPHRAPVDEPIEPSQQVGETKESILITYKFFGEDPSAPVESKFGEPSTSTALL